MSLVNLTRSFVSESIRTLLTLREVHLKSQNTEYTGMVWNIQTDTMVGTYLDFAGHIKETDDGVRADNADVAGFFRQPATLIRLAKQDREGAVCAQELRAANGGSDRTLPFLIVNALAAGLDPHDIEGRSVYFDDSAVQWIIDSGCKVLISDIYESQALEGVFLKLFSHGVSTVCEPVNLWKLKGTPLVTVSFPMMPTSQVPVSLVAEVED